MKDYVQPLFNSLQNDCYHFLYDFISVLHYCGGIMAHSALHCCFSYHTIPYPNLFIQHFKNYTADQSAVQQIYFLLLLMVLKHLIPYEPLNQLMRARKPQIKLPLNIRIRKCCNFSDSSLFLRLYWDFSPTAVYRNYYNRVIVPQHRKQNIVDHFKSKISRLKSKLYFEKKNIQSSNHGSLL